MTAKSLRIIGKTDWKVKKISFVLRSFGSKQLYVKYFVTYSLNISLPNTCAECWYNVKRMA